MNRLRWAQQILGIGILTVLCILPLSCKQFFSTSLAPWAARDPASLIPSVSASNVNELIAQSANDPDLALEVLKGIQSAASAASGQDLITLQVASVSAASNASGLGTAILQNAGNIVDSLSGSNSTAVIDLVSNAVSGLTQLTPSGTALTAILPSPSDATAYNAFVSQAAPEDLAMAAVTILAAQAQTSGNVTTYINSFPASPTVGTPEYLAAQLAGSAKTKYAAEGGTGPLADILVALNLTT